MILVTFDHFFVLIVGQCEYEGKICDINQTYITLDCKKSCIYVYANGIVEHSCNELCTIPEDPGCTENTQQVEIYQELVKGSNCSRPTKRCITGLKLFRENQRKLLF